ncbi:sorbosone dehydrogenase family protein [Chitinophaga pendula]|uniref:PQQ-dependent sugar dehydrogenase n=1 Tax=Chitinophaga TaxID=79328 RepID=UPI000BAF2DAA|nr:MULTISPECIES: sorbosone dehydrogenase family protein [Chitinophaga]ASZ11035.1 L-sorbosone dehydrogenase [Chitinophaga sp. MD30]UCJ05968.1 sorbosone dehydrogenase family protein [Chitinophaga pendula]
MKHASFFVLLALCAGVACNSQGHKDPGEDSTTVAAGGHNGVADSLPAPYATKSVTNFSKVLGWSDGKTPKAPAGFTVTKYADGFQNPRWIYVLPNGDVLVAEANTKRNLPKKIKEVVTGKAQSGNMRESADRITLLRDANNDGQPEVRAVFLENLNQPLGMLLLKDQFYVANTDGILVFPYKVNATRIDGKGRQILTLPAGGYNNHWTRNIISNKDGSRIFVSVGSGSNVGEHGMENELRRANILEISPDGSGERIYASGLRNPVGMDWAPGSHVLWTVVNERDELGDELVPDYLTGVKPNGFYGWPYAYFGQHEDPRLKGQRPDLVAKTLVPDVPLGSHTASLGLVFYNTTIFPSRYQNGAFIGQHGSWNRSALSGYKVVFVPFANGRPSGAPEDFLTGFMAEGSKSEVYGRPVGLAVARDGALLVADDAANTIWRVSASKP